jgi:HSP20 family molecular chaperone IbpA
MTEQRTEMTHGGQTGPQLQQQEQGIEVVPPVDILENQEEVVVVADLPGVSSDDVHVRLDPPELFLQGTQHAPSLEMPFQPLTFTRRFQVPEGLDPNKVEAELNEGVLRLRMPKAEEVKPKRIPVRSG